MRDGSCMLEDLGALLSERQAAEGNERGDLRPFEGNAAIERNDSDLEAARIELKYHLGLLVQVGLSRRTEHCKCYCISLLFFHPVPFFPRALAAFRAFSCYSPRHAEMLVSAYDSPLNRRYGSSWSLLTDTFSALLVTDHIAISATLPHVHTSSHAHHGSSRPFHLILRQSRTSFVL